MHLVTLLTIFYVGESKRTTMIYISSQMIHYYIICISPGNVFLYTHNTGKESQTENVGDNFLYICSKFIYALRVSVNFFVTVHYIGKLLAINNDSNEHNLSH